jgi:hypothetical protein
VATGPLAKATQRCDNFFNEMMKKKSCIQTPGGKRFLLATPAAG